MTDDHLDADLGAIARATSANTMVSLLLGLWDEAVARGAGPEVFEQLAEHLTSAVPNLADCPTGALAAEAVTTAYRSFSVDAEPLGGPVTDQAADGSEPVPPDDDEVDLVPKPNRPIAHVDLDYSWHPSQIVGDSSSS